MKKLSAETIMNRKVLTVREEMTVREAATFLVENGISGAPVLATSGEVIGVVSLSDIAQITSEDGQQFSPDTSDFYLRSRQYQFELDEMNVLHIHDEEIPVTQIMTPAVFTVPHDASIEEIAQKMITERIHRVFVKKGRQILGIISTLDMLQLLIPDRSKE